MSILGLSKRAVDERGDRLLELLLLESSALGVHLQDGTNKVKWCRNLRHMKSWHPWWAPPFPSVAVNNVPDHAVAQFQPWSEGGEGSDVLEAEARDAEGQEYAGYVAGSAVAVAVGDAGDAEVAAAAAAARASHAVGTVQYAEDDGRIAVVGTEGPSAAVVVAVVHTGKHRIAGDGPRHWAASDMGYAAACAAAN